MLSDVYKRQDVDNRSKKVEHFWETGELDEKTNVSFGEGGAGTFSDGKLNTLVKDKLMRNRKVLEIFVEHGAPEEILYQQKPHIGTDEMCIRDRWNAACQKGRSSRKRRSFGVWTASYLQ